MAHATPQRRTTRSRSLNENASGRARGRLGDFVLTGEQDCGNAFSIDEFDLDEGGTAEAIVARTIAEWVDNGIEQEWIDQQDDDTLDGIDPHEAFEAWLSGYHRCAVFSVQSAQQEIKDRTVMYYVAETDENGEPIEFVERFDDLDDAQAAFFTMKKHRAAIYEGDLNGPQYLISSTTIPRSGRAVLPSRWKNPPARHPSDVGEVEVMQKFRELLADPDPASMDIAEDLLLEHGLKLTDIGESIAKNGIDNQRGDTAGWANDFPSAGTFVVSRTLDPEVIAVADPAAYAAVDWMVWRPRGDHARKGFRLEIVISYNGLTWSETKDGAYDGGVRGLGSRVRTKLGTSFTTAEQDHLNSLAPLVHDVPGSLKAARAMACDLAWKIAKKIKERPDLDPMEFVMALHHGHDLLQVGARVDWRARKTHKPKFGTPRALINPRDNASGNWEVRSETGLEGIFAREEDARDYADELKHGVGARVEVRRRRPSLTGPSSKTGNPPKQLTYADARLNIIYLLEDRGWTVSKALKIPHATSPDGSLRLWFKPQAVWYTSLSGHDDLGSSGYYHGKGKRHDYGDARSLWFDIRAVSNEQFLAQIQRQFPTALAAFP